LVKVFDYVHTLGTELDVTHALGIQEEDSFIEASQLSDGPPYDQVGDAHLPYRDLRHAEARSAIFVNADLTSADLRCANLRGADLRHATLANARLDGADLTGTKLDGAITDECDFHDVVGYEK
jgi:uncharacterized protein YjbI with pentapeptide repeats